MRAGALNPTATSFDFRHSATVSAVSELERMPTGCQDKSIAGLVQFQGRSDVRTTVPSRAAHTTGCSLIGPGKPRINSPPRI